MGRLMAVHALLEFGRHSVFTWRESSRLLRTNEPIHRLHARDLFLFLGKLGGRGWGEHAMVSLTLTVSDDRVNPDNTDLDNFRPVWPRLKAYKIREHQTLVGPANHPQVEVTTSMTTQWLFESLPDSSPSYSSVETSPLFTPPTNLQHPDTVPSNERYYSQEGFDFLLQASSSPFPRFPFQPQPSPLGRYIGRERESFETLPHFASEDLIFNMLGGANESATVAAAQRPPTPPREPGPSLVYEAPALQERGRHIETPAPQLRRYLDASAYDHYFRGDHQRKQRKVLDSCLGSDWLAYDWPEPFCGKHSIFRQFLSLPPSTKESMRCLFDGCSLKFDRVDRAVGHVRTHLKHRPFVCTGGCSSGKCRKRFASPANLHSHLTRRTQACERCGKHILPQNMRRHLKRHA